MKFLLRFQNSLPTTALMQPKALLRSCVALFLFIAAVGTIQAQQDTILLTVDAPDNPVNCGDTVTYYITGTNITDQISGLTFSVTWNTGQLAYVSSAIDSAVFAPGADYPFWNADPSTGDTEENSA